MKYIISILLLALSGPVLTDKNVETPTYEEIMKSGKSVEKPTYKKNKKSVKKSVITGSYLCIADKATGFAFDETNNEWVTTTYNVSKHKYLISPISNDHRFKDQFSYIVKNFKTGEEEAYCDNEIDFFGDLKCKAYEYELHFNIISNRFIGYQLTGYHDVTKNGYIKDGDVSPYMEIGICSKI